MEAFIDGMAVSSLSFFLPLSLSMLGSIGYPQLSIVPTYSNGIVCVVCVWWV